jgi:hypothetical protein
METKLILAKDINDVKWDDLVEESKQGHIYHLYQYIDTLCSGNWQAVILENQDNYIAAFPFFVKKKMGVAYFIHPPFCQYWGVMIRLDKAGNQKYYDESKKLVKLVLEAIPKNIKYMLSYFSPSLDYPLPLVWADWSLSPNYTYQVKLDRNQDAILASFASHTRREIKKADKNGIKIIKEKGADTAMTIFRSEKPHLVNSKNDEYLVNLNKVVHTLGEDIAFSLNAVQGEETAASIVYFKYKKMLIYFFGTVKATHKNSGAMSAIIWESIKMHHEECSILDFDGSMIEDIERYFRGFGAEPVMYLKAERSFLPKWINLS